MFISLLPQTLSCYLFKYKVSTRILHFSAKTKYSMLRLWVKEKVVNLGFNTKILGKVCFSKDWHFRLINWRRTLGIYWVKANFWLLICIDKYLYGLGSLYVLCLNSLTIESHSPRHIYHKKEANTDTVTVTKLRLYLEFTSFCIFWFFNSIQVVLIMSL